MVKNPPSNAGDTGYRDSVPGSRRFRWRRKWQPTPVFLPEESHGHRSLVGYSTWGHKESDMTERRSNNNIVNVGCTIFPQVVFKGSSFCALLPTLVTFNFLDFELSVEEVIELWGFFYFRKKIRIFLLW